MMVQIHPSVIMAISEHHTRLQAIHKEPEISIGALLGTKSDNLIEVVDSFELRFTKDPDDDHTRSFVIDREFYQRKIPLVKQVSPELDLIGWYATTLPDKSIESREGDISLHRQILEFIPSPIFLKMNPYKREQDPKISATLPLNVYEPIIETEGDGEKLNLNEVNWTIVTEDVEVIGLEHNAKMTQFNVTSSAAVDNLRLQHSTVKMLKDRVRVISKYVKDVSSGAIPYADEPMRNIAKLCARFPLMSCPQYVRAYNVQCNDVALNTYLGILTKGSMCKLNFGAPTIKSRAFSTTTHARK